MRSCFQVGIVLLILALTGSCVKHEGKIANPVAVEVYKVTITQFPENAPGGGTWDSEIPFSDPFGRPDLHVFVSDNLTQAIGSQFGYTRLNAIHSNLPINFDIDSNNVVALDKFINIDVSDHDDFDADDYMGSLRSDSLAKFKDEQPGSISVAAGSVAATVYIRWK